MNINDMVGLINDQTHTNSNQVTQDQCISYLNIVKNNFWSYMISYMRENYNEGKFFIPTVQGADTYEIPEIAADTAGLKKVSELSICYDGATDENGNKVYIKAKPVSRDNLPEDWDYYTLNQPKTKPIFAISANNIMIAPLPTQNQSNALKIRGPKKIPDYTISTTDENIVIPEDYRDILIQGALPYAYKSIGKMQESNVEKQEYIRQRDEAMKGLVERNNGPILLTYPEETTDDSLLCN